MFKTILFPIALFLTINAKGQKDLKSYVIENTVSIPTIEPDSVNYDDLEIIGKSIGGAKIVMLGEQDHGDAPTFLAKTRIIKYLHEKMGFNVVAFESDFFGLNFGYDRIEKNELSIDSFLKKNIFPIWAYCNTCQSLFNKYIPSTYQTEKPLTVTGFDNQMVLLFSAKHLTNYVDSLLTSLDVPITKQENYKREILPLIDSLKYFSFKDTSNYTKCAAYLLQIKAQVRDKVSENNFWLQVINNLIAENSEYQIFKADYIGGGNIRDAQMASNLKWLSEVKFPKEKIIVWAANAHVAKFIDSSGRNGRKMISMGSFFTDSEKYLKETYIIGFTSYEGEAGRLGFKTYTVRKPKPNGFENWINKSINYSFTDFKTYRMNYPDKSEMFYLKGMGHNSAFKKDWTKVFDGIFYIREMYPCER
ncbi:MAG: erythromycin esterase family protein [Chitinophagaceae bacterium]|nr:erythromycin esterase family protein [Chitinophagaceae bacterium]MCW5927126.1 erythromycin esterase family protein [Chitinophagaceae bacterium]